MDAIHRRDFLVSFGATVTLAALDLPTRSATKENGFRTITYNVLKCHGYAPTPSARPRLALAERQIPFRIAHELALYRPDIVTFQEGPSESVLREIADLLGMQPCFFPGGWNGAVITRFKIVRSENRPGATAPPSKDLFTRHWGRAVLQIGTEEVCLYSAHLHPSDAGVRAREVTKILSVLANDLQQDKNVLFQGDLNHKPDGVEYERWVKAGLKDSFTAKGSGITETCDSHKPEKRIDYIWTHGPIAYRLIESRVLYEGAFRTNPSDPLSFALSDHIPVTACFG